MRARAVSSVLAALLLAFPGACGAQDPGPAPTSEAYRLNVRLVLVDAQVVNRKTGQVITSLKQNDLKVYEDGVQQQITFFSQDELPLSVVLLFDLTDSVRPVLKALAEGAIEALQHLKPQDEVAVMVYAASARVIQDFTTDRALAAGAIDSASRMDSREAAFFNEAIFRAASQLGNSKQQNSRRVIIWLTDDVPNIPSEEIKARYGKSLFGRLHTEKDALRELFRTGTVVCTLLKRSDISEAEDARRDSSKVISGMLYPPGEVYKYARASGGLVLDSSGKKLKARLAEMIDDIRLRYSLGYHPSAVKANGKFCAIKIKLAPAVNKSHKNLVVEAKQGYYR
jgi:VWFA-related protein